MIITNTNNVDNAQVTEYIGLVFGEVIEGVNFLKDFAAGLRNFVGGRSGTYEQSLIQARSEAINEMAVRAQQMGADAILGVKVDYETLGEGGSMLMVTASGTAVKLQRK
ncbi:MAG: YbjQ family protein [Anaerolineaceae bacterium]|nr:YbjQ family protein [Anaerolineaceae bacterium]